MDYTAVGDTTNVAGRLQQAGEPGRVTVSEATHRLVRGYFETRPLGEIHLKGKAEPVTAWEVVAARETVTRLEVEADHGLTPFVGRERELAVLLDAFARAQAGEGQVLFLVGDAGIGKSRLLLELRRRIGDGAAWQEGHCLSFGKAMAFHPLVDLLRRQFGVGEGLALAERIGDDSFIPRFLNTLGWLRIDCGDFALGIELSEKSDEITARSSRAGHGTGAERHAFIRNNEADALMAQGDLAGAAEALKDSLHTIQHPPPSRWMTWRYAIHCYASLGQLALLRGEAALARRMADQSLELATPTSSREYESWAWRVKGESATALGAWDEAEDALRRSCTIAQSIRQPRSTWLSEVASGRLDAARGRREDALGHYRTVRALIASLRAGVRDPGLRAGLESSPLVREVEDLARPE